MAKFYGHFAAAYGTCFLVLLVLAVVTQSHIETGMFGLVGFPVIAIIYAWVRLSSDRDDAKVLGDPISGVADDTLTDRVATIIRASPGKILRIRIEEA